MARRFFFSFNPVPRSRCRRQAFFSLLTTTEFRVALYNYMNEYMFPLEQHYIYIYIYTWVFVHENLLCFRQSFKVRRKFAEWMYVDVASKLHGRRMLGCAFDVVMCSACRQTRYTEESHHELRSQNSPIDDRPVHHHVLTSTPPPFLLQRREACTVFSFFHPSRRHTGTFSWLFCDNHFSTRNCKIARSNSTRPLSVALVYSGW